LTKCSSTSIISDVLTVSRSSMQDGAPSHRSKHMVTFLQTNVPDFIEPLNSPDLNPVNYCIWGSALAGISSKD